MGRFGKMLVLTGLVAAVATRAGAEVGEAAIFAAAEACHSAGDHRCALDKAELLLSRYPASAMRDLALASVARSAVALGDLSRAAAAVSKLRQESPLARGYVGLEPSLRRLAGPAQDAPPASATASAGLAAAIKKKAVALESSTAGDFLLAALNTPEPLICLAATSDPLAAIRDRQQRSEALAPVAPVVSVTPRLSVVPLAMHDASIGSHACTAFEVAATAPAEVTAVARGLQPHRLMLGGAPVAALRLFPQIPVTVEVCGTVPAGLRNGDTVPIELIVAAPGAEPARARVIARLSRADLRATFISQPSLAASDGTPVTLTLLNAGKSAASGVAVELEAGHRQRLLFGAMPPGDIAAVTVRLMPTGAPQALRYCVIQDEEAADCRTSPPLEIR